VESGDRLLISAGVDAVPLVRLVAEQAYRGGAHNVEVAWSDGPIERSRFADGPEAAAAEIPHHLEVYRKAAARRDSFLNINTRDPALLADVDTDRVAGFQKNVSEELLSFTSSLMALDFIWCAVAAPSPAWARSVFPDLDESEAVDRLWQAVFATCRVDEPDPVAAWTEHLDGLASRCVYLTGRGYDRLRYSGPGTNLTVGLPDGHCWIGGAEGKRGSVPNLPTEEVFTSPDRMRADGLVRVAKPLSYLGTIIDGIELRFEAGAVVAASAESGRDALDRLLEMDQGSVRLGEAALVPQSSLVAAQQLIWRNTLYDENDACHLALGRAYPIALAGGTEMSAGEQVAAGLNHSSIHVDLVVGSSELDVFGVAEGGAEEPLMVGGEWAFSV
jgi:aminopeptidase